MQHEDLQRLYGQMISECEDTLRTVLAQVGKGNKDNDQILRGDLTGKQWQMVIGALLHYHMSTTGEPERAFAILEERYGEEAVGLSVATLLTQLAAIKK